MSSSRRHVTAALAALLLAACDPGPDPAVALGTLERDRIEIQAESWETLIEVAVTEGETVAAGAVIARQDAARVDAALARAEAASLGARRRLDELLRGPRAEDIEEGQARLRGATSQLDADEREYNRVEDLVRRALLSESDLDRALARREVSRAARDEAESRLEALLEGTTIEELDQTRAALAEAEADVADLRLTRERLTIRATRDGLIDTLPFEVGERPPAGGTVAVLLADSAPYARVYVLAAIRADVAAGTPATVTVDGVETVFEGRVRTVSAEAAFTPYFALTERDRGRLSYLAEIVLSEPEAEQLPTGLPVEVRFDPSPRRQATR
jgi:HlyD family secretion protein